MVPLLSIFIIHVLKDVWDRGDGETTCRSLRFFMALYGSLWLKGLDLLLAWSSDVQLFATEGGGLAVARKRFILNK